MQTSAALPRGIANTPNQRLQVFSGRSNPELSREITNFLKITPGEIEINDFADGETCVRVKESVRGNFVAVVQSTCPPVNSNLVELCLMLDALKRASAEDTGRCPILRIRATGQENERTRTDIGKNGCEHDHRSRS